MSWHSLLKHSFLNILRNKRRTLMVLFILGASTTILFLTKSYLEQMYRGMRLGYTTSSGHIQIAQKGFWRFDEEEPDSSILEPDIIEEIEDIFTQIPQIRSFNKELSFQGMIGTAQNSSIISGMGIEPSKRGGYAGFVYYKDGQELSHFDEEAILIGKPAADKIRVDASQWVNLMSHTVDNSINLISAQIKGIISTGRDEIDLYFAAAPISFIQSLRGTEGIERYLLFLREEEQVPEVLERLKEIFQEEGLDLDLRSWQELNSFYFGLKGLYDAIFTFVIGIISFLVFLSVMEIISMSFFERFRELGTLRAIGNTRGDIFFILIIEAFLFYIIGLASGGIVGAIIGQIINNMNLVWFPPGSSESVPFAFFLRLRFMLLPTVVLFFASLLAALIPAIKSAGKEVVEILKYE